MVEHRKDWESAVAPTGAVLMETSPNGTACQLDPLSINLETVRENRDAGEARLLLEAFQMFTQASSSLETAFRQLQARTRHLSDELAAKNRELKKSLREKEEVQNYLARILESLPCGVLVLDEDGRVTLCNPVAGQILGQRGASKAKKPERWNAAVRRYLAAFTARENGGGEVEIPFVSGGKPRVLATASTQLKTAAGNKAGTLHIIRDITEMKALEAQSKRSERLAAMGEMAVELAHEIRNPLGSIELFASLLEKELSGQSDPGRWAENIRIGSRSLNNIVSNMLHFANPLAPEFLDVDLHDLIREILGFAEPILQQREVRVETRLEAHRSAVSGDRELLKQMILNVVLNSLQAMPSEGSLTVGTRDVHSLPGGALCKGVELIVQDTGLGIPLENLGRIFDPFFTTNKNGTGLGLSVVHQIVEQHSGFIHVESEVNIGTTFTVILPCARLASGAA
jgi:two-component system sensor histidine kinase FlrB